MTMNRKLIAVFIAAALWASTCAITACSGVSVAQNIVNWTPALQSAVATVDATASLLDPVNAPIYTAATVGFDAASNLLVAQCKTYLANPTGTVLAILQAQVVSFQQNVNTALLQAAKITNTQSQQQALAAIQGVSTIVSAILALVATISSKTAQAQMVASSTVKLAQVEPYINRQRSIQQIADHYEAPTWWAASQYDQGMARLQADGF
jgi:hypothetical protein